MPGVIKSEHSSEKCPKCNGTGAPLLVPGDPTSGNDVKKVCDACGGSGFIDTTKHS